MRLVLRVLNPGAVVEGVGDDHRVHRSDVVVPLLRRAGDAARTRDEAALAEVATWLSGLGAGDLVAVDARARTGWAPVLGPSEGWRRAVDGSAPTAAVVVAAMHADGHVRERAVRHLVTRDERLADRVLALRAADHVEQVRAPAVRELLSRTCEAQVLAVVPVLLRLGDRVRAVATAEAYVAAAERRHGVAALWALLRGGSERPVRRQAFRHSAEHGLLDVGEAAARVVQERDAVVRNLCVRLVAEHGSADSVRSLLSSRSAQGRVLALVRLPADEVGEDELRRLLVDRSELVRVWARRRTAEIGGDPVAACAAAARSDAAPAVRASAYLGLVEAGGVVPRPEVLGLVGSGVPALVRIGLQLLTGHVTADDVGPLLHLVATSSARTSRPAEDALTEALGVWAVDDLEPLWSSPAPAVRQRAWRLHRRRGGWETTIADLRAVRDPDRQVSAQARRVAPPPQGAPSADQRARLRELLLAARLHRRTEHLLALTAGLPHVPASRPRGLQRALLDLDADRRDKALARLFGLLAADPTDLDVRHQLAETYRRLGEPAQAGRWGFLRDGSATEAECAAFVRHVAGRRSTYVGRDTMRTYLRVRDPGSLADEVGRRRLEAASLRPPGALSRLWGRIRARAVKAGGSRVP